MKLVSILQTQMLPAESTQGRFVFVIDQTLCSQQGNKTENTYSTGSRPKRPRKGRRYSKCNHVRSSVTVS